MNKIIIILLISIIYVNCHYNYNDNKICNCHYNLNDDLNENITIEITNDFNIRLLFKLLIFTSILSNYMHTIIYIMNNH